VPCLLDNPSVSCYVIHETMRTAKNNRHISPATRVRIRATMVLKTRYKQSPIVVALNGMLLDSHTYMFNSIKSKGWNLFSPLDIVVWDHFALPIWSSCERLSHAT
jgi:hypothetical protein